MSKVVHLQLYTSSSLARKEDIGKFPQPTANSGSHDQSPDDFSMIISPQTVSWKIIPCKDLMVLLRVFLGSNVFFQGYFQEVHPLINY